MKESDHSSVDHPNLSTPSKMDNDCTSDMKEKTDDTVPENAHKDAEQNLSPDNYDESQSLILTELPEEILIHIASFIESRVICSSLYSVCKLFYDLFSDDRYWKTRISQRCNKPYPVFECELFETCVIVTK